MTKQRFDGGLTHFTAVRGRIVGSGILKLFVRSLDNLNYIQLAPLTMLPITNREPNVLCNYIDQRGQIEFKVVNSGEYFVISGLNIFIKPVATGYPQ